MFDAHYAGLVQQKSSHVCLQSEIQLNIIAFLRSHCLDKTHDFSAMTAELRHKIVSCCFLLQMAWTDDCSRWCCSVRSTAYCPHRYIITAWDLTNLYIPTHIIRFPVMAEVMGYNVFTLHLAAHANLPAFSSNPRPKVR